MTNAELAASPATRSGDPTRHQLVLAALELFAVEGVNATSIRSITAHAGAANQSAVHYHFRNKDGLILAVLDYVNEQLTPPQNEALLELKRMKRQRALNVREIVSIGFAPYVQMYLSSQEGQICLRFLSRLTWESGPDAQDLLLEKVRPYFLKILPYLEAACPDKPHDALDFQLYLAAANLIHGLSDLTLLSRQTSGSVAKLLKNRPEDMLSYFIDYIAGGLLSPTG
ncbi:MAG: TetR family transcriptional regulator [Sinimarinibacterium sp.]|jgi:AcrR family transcriptional regulator